MLAVTVLALVLSAALYVKWQALKAKIEWRAIDPAILKNGASAKKLKKFCTEPVDYIIVGSGLGALTTASLLTQHGFRVLVLEQHDIAGGSTHTFELDGFEWDVGFHYIGENADKWWSPVRKLFAVMSGGALEWCALNDDYDFAVNEVTGQKIGINKDPRAKFEALCRSGGDYAENARCLAKYKRACMLAKLSAASLFFFKLFPRWAYPRRLLGWAWDWGAARSAVDVMKNCGMSDDLIGRAAYLYCSCVFLCLPRPPASRSRG